LGLEQNYITSGTVLMRTIIAIGIVVITCICLRPAQAADDPSVAEAIRSLASAGAAKCPNLQDQLTQAREKGNADAISALEGAYRTMCVCMPAQLQALRSSLSPAQLSAKSSQSTLRSRYTNEVVGKCAADQLRANYSEGCAQRYGKIRPNSDRYCQCMSGKLAKLPDSEADALGAASSDYTPQVNEAKKKGQPPPEPPPALKQFFADERACSTP
jgi:hypothetical protein